MKFGGHTRYTGLQGGLVFSLLFANTTKRDPPLARRAGDHVVRLCTRSWSPLPVVYGSGSSRNTTVHCHGMFLSSAFGSSSCARIVAKSPYGPGGSSSAPRGGVATTCSRAHFAFGTGNASWIALPRAFCCSALGAHKCNCAGSETDGGPPSALPPDAAVELNNAGARSCTSAWTCIGVESADAVQTGASSSTSVQPSSAAGNGW
mmetsp:Transcript_37817/g.116854  ORF Transcript_37817/g.116854 Transcript_37817/m.116854 type:complete len:205 (+) Transcript_37817:81-695(+)